MRFPEFKDSFEITSISKLLKVKMGQSPDSSSYNSEGIGVPLVQGNADIENRITKPQRYTSSPSSKFCEIDDTLISVRAPVGSISKSNVRACIGRGIASLGNLDNFTYQFFLLKETSWDKIAQGSTFTCITAKDIENLTIGIPSLEERIKIGNFLSLLDERIDTQNKIIRDLKAEFLFLLNSCFAGEKNATIGAYIKEESHRNKQNKEYPVFSVSNKRGFIPQNEQFDDREVASNDKTNYKVVSLNQFAYNPARINVGSIGLYKNETPCIISPMYNVFSVVSIDPFILELYFKSSYFINEMNKRLEGSVRMCLTIDGLKGIKFHLPSQTFLNSFSKAMDVLRRKIELEENLLSFYQTQKKYLLVNLFI